MRAEKSANLHWIAEYADGSTKTEADTTYLNLPRLNLVSFGLFTEDNTPVSILQLSKTKTLFYRSRVVLDVSGGSSERIYFLGYRQRNGVVHLKVVGSDGKLSTHKSFEEAKHSEIEYYPQEQV